MEKPCIACGQVKPIGAYYQHPRMADGHLNKCKECQKASSRKTYRLRSRDPEWVEAQRARHREKYHRLGDRWNVDATSKRKVRARYSRRYPYKILAAAAAAEVIVPDGRQRHHWSYREEHWTDIIPLRTAPHKRLHRFLLFDPDTRMFRTKPGGDLLDTKAAHLQFALSILRLCELDQPNSGRREMP